MKRLIAVALVVAMSGAVAKGNANDRPPPISAASVGGQEQRCPDAGTNPPTCTIVVEIRPNPDPATNKNYPCEPHVQSGLVVVAVGTTPEVVWKISTSPDDAGFLYRFRKGASDADTGIHFRDKPAADDFGSLIGTLPSHEFRRLSKNSRFFGTHYFLNVEGVQTGTNKTVRCTRGDPIIVNMGQTP